MFALLDCSVYEAGDEEGVDDDIEWQDKERMK